VFEANAVIDYAIALTRAAARQRPLLLVEQSDVVAQVVARE